MCCLLLFVDSARCACNLADFCYLEWFSVFLSVKDLQPFAGLFCVEGRKYEKMAIFNPYVAFCLGIGI